MAGTKKTDNHYTGDKVALRIDHSPWPKTGALKVLDIFGGHGVIWRSIERKTGSKIERTAIDNRLDLLDFHIHGDNRKVLQGLDLRSFDVIDVDAYGVPISQLTEIFDSGFRGTVFATVIQTMHGGVPKMLCDDLGFPAEAQAKCPTLLGRRGFEYVKQWLALRGVNKIHVRSKNRKHYLAFEIKEIGK